MITNSPVHGLSGDETGPGVRGTDGAGVRGPQGFVFALFFIFGGVTSLNDVVIPKPKALFT